MPRGIVPLERLATRYVSPSSSEDLPRGRSLGENVERPGPPSVPLSPAFTDPVLHWNPSPVGVMSWFDVVPGT